LTLADLTNQEKIKRPMATDNPRLDVAVFIDFENVYVSVRDKLDVNPNFEIIMDRVADLGRVVIARAYADWYRYPRVTSALYANGIEPMYVPTYYYDRDLGRTGRAIKNSVDMNLCIDAMKTLYTNPNIAKFVLATGDRDFIPLVNAIRQHGKEVIIIGVGGAASGHLAQSADEFIFYEQLLGKKPQPLQADVPRIRMAERGRDVVEVEEPAPAPRQRAEPQPTERAQPPTPEPAREEPDIYDMLVQAVHLARERGYVCSFGSLKLVMKELMGGEFKESKYRDSNGKPFAKFKDFALEAERRGKVQVFTSGAIVEVFLPGEDPYKLSQFAQDLKEEPPVSTPETPINVDAHIDGRPVSTSRRRRRRRGSATRPSAAETSAVLSQSVELTGDVEDELITEALHEAANGQNASSDEVFEELLDRLEAERERQEALASFDMLAPDTSPMLDELPDLEEEPERDLRLEVPDLAGQMIIVDTPVEPPEPFESIEPVGDTVVHTPEMRPFTEAEWQMLRNVVAAAGRPLTFAQIHDLLREARNNAGIFRTNEELRSLIKQAINSGMLRRSGKGARIVYHLAPQESLEHTEQPSDAASDPLSEVSVVAYAVETGFVFVPEGEASEFAAAPAEAMAATGAEEAHASTLEGVPGEAMTEAGETLDASRFAAAPAEAMAATGAEEAHASTLEGVPGEAMTEAGETLDASGFAAAPAEAMAATGAEEAHASTLEGVPGEAMTEAGETLDASGFAAAPAEAMAATGAEEAHATGSAEAPVTTIAESAVTAQETETGESAPIVATVEEQPKPRRRRAPRVKAETDEVSANVQTDVSAADVATESSPRRSRRKTATEAADATPRAPRRRKPVEKQDREVTEDTSVT
jgi:uncharacterized protein (TIGR00288 family)